AEGRTEGVQPGGGALPDRGGAHDGPVEPLHGAATGVPGSAARSAWPGGPCGGAAGEPAAAGQAAEDLCRVRAVPHAGWETAPWYCATTLLQAGRADGQDRARRSPRLEPRPPRRS